MSGELMHYGTPRHSGRYPWGSGKNGYQRAVSWRKHIQQLRDQGLSDVEISRAEGITTTQLRARLSINKSEIRAAKASLALRMKDRGYSTSEIARRMDINESSVRSLLNPALNERAKTTKNISNMLQENVDAHKYIDVGTGVENYIGVSRTMFNNAVAELKEKGYKVHKVNVSQIGMPGKFTIVKVLGAPDTEWKDLVKDTSQIKNIDVVSKDHGRTFQKGEDIFDPKKVQIVDSSRLAVKYGDEGGKLRDGVIELRRGVKDLNMGGSQYAQVRINIDGTHYLKGMAIYSDDLPKGIDIRFNSNKSRTKNKLDALKKIKDDPDNPFGSSIKPGGQRGALNIVNEEGDWDRWSKTLSSQVLSKQTVPLAKKQLALAFDQKREEYDEISKLTNPVVKKQLLLAFADGCDASAVHLKAAGLPRQASKVILPIPELKPNEIYAPTFRNGESVVLIRHPHGGIFEIPQLHVNNKSPKAQSVMKNATDAIGINPIVAQKLSGADFDGDTVIVIPNNKGQIKTASSLKGLRNFDPSESYPPYDRMKTIDGGIYNAKTKEVKYAKKPHLQTKQTKMGEISNLITDMTIKGAGVDEISRAVRHSMVVIDSEKHHLNYKQSYIDNGISELSAKYQNSKRGGASTLISRASSTVRVPERKEGKYITDPSTGKSKKIYIDPRTGKKLYTDTGSNYVNEKGKTIYRTVKSTKMAETDDAYKLSSGKQIEETYAEHANKLKTLANAARKDALSVTPTPYSPSARKVYSNEIASLDAKLSVATKNKPLERQAQIVANSIVSRKRQANPELGDDKDAMKKVRNAALAEARVRVGAKKNMVDVSPKEWEAIQEGAVSPSKLEEIIANADLDKIKQLATPREVSSMPTAKINRAKSLLDNGLTQSEVAEALGVSTSTLSKALK